MKVKFGWLFVLLSCSAFGYDAHSHSLFDEDDDTFLQPSDFLSYFPNFLSPNTDDDSLFDFNTDYNFQLYFLTYNDLIIENFDIDPYTIYTFDDLNMFDDDFDIIPLEPQW